ncbi:CYTH and CHAD domain-containing protein [Nitrospirillum pindoramense]|uniref:Inorganic triphosphatase YgiF n=1 Tax=Nitrospirillum amazonense TaxID=28077 RepID=A0A560H651_9PROT|nr:CYTH and CHAD domain-containing protein [Nitrospirillum amazonense]TWB41773.1 inorganic triphosphatase YgiF [Nitrospirillum amazonense]
MPENPSPSPAPSVPTEGAAIPVEADAPQEIELKLAVAPEHLSRLKSAPVLAGARAVTKTLHNTYFDTPEGELATRGVSLRLRQSGPQGAGKVLQTLKGPSAGAGMAMSRSEWEIPAPDGHLVPQAFTDPAAQALLDGVDLRRLAPVFSNEVKRWTRTLPLAAGLAVEVAVDQGVTRAADGREEAIAEVELELAAGQDRRVLYDLALALHRTVPLRLEPRSKAERGYALARGELTSAKAVKAGPLNFKPDETVEAALAGVARACLHHMAANEAAVLAGDPSGVHQLRVAVRRLRSALTLFKAILPDAQGATLKAALKGLADAVGPARSWDVFLEELLAPVSAAMPEQESLEALAVAAQGARGRGHAAARAAVSGPGYTELLLTLGRWVDGRCWRDEAPAERLAWLGQPLLPFADAVLTRQRHRAAKRGRHFARLDAPARHGLRIALKKLRYAVDFFREIYPQKGVRRYLERLSALQDGLGHLNDVATMDALVRDLRADLAAAKDVSPAGWDMGAGLVLGWHAAHMAVGEEALCRAVDGFMDADPFWTPADHWPHPPS